jgi:hypothetical protein
MILSFFGIKQLRCFIERFLFFYFFFCNNLTKLWVPSYEFYNSFVYITNSNLIHIYNVALVENTCSIKTVEINYGK